MGRERQLGRGRWIAAGAVGGRCIQYDVNGAVRENHVVEFEEGRLIAWKPAEQGRPPVGHLWRWEVESIDANHCRVTHTYDWTNLHDENRYTRALATTSDRLLDSIDRLLIVVAPR